MRHRHGLIRNRRTISWGGKVGASTSRTSTLRKAARARWPAPRVGHRPPSCCGGSSKRPGSATVSKHDEDATNRVDVWRPGLRLGELAFDEESSPQRSAEFRRRNVLGPNPQIPTARVEPKPGPLRVSATISTPADASMTTAVTLLSRRAVRAARLQHRGSRTRAQDPREARRGRRGRLPASNLRGGWWL